MPATKNPAAVVTESIPEKATPSTLKVQKARAVVIKGPDEGISLEIGIRRAIVGRAPSCDMVLTDPTVSGMHLELALEPAGVLVRNLESRNGTHAGGTRIEEGVIEFGTQLAVGRTLIRIDALEERTDVPVTSDTRMGELIGSSLKMRMLFGRLQQYAAADSPVLIEGDTGTGKELAARAVHDLSKRAQGPYEILDCGALPDQMIEAELFGVGKGAISDTTSARPGVFERAEGGTVVLEEIGELPLRLQPALLQVLERGQVRRLGEQTPRRINCRIIATTNRVLAREVQAGRFRQDLYFRLGVLHVTIPPLRHRKEDIALLVEHFLGSNHGFPASWVRVLEEYEWPGNVRELKNALLRAQAYARRHGPNVPLEVLLTDEPFVEELESARSRFEKQYLQLLLGKCGHNIARAAKLAGLTRQGLYRLLHKNGLGPAANNNRRYSTNGEVNGAEERDR